MVAILLLITSLQVYHVPPPDSPQSLRALRDLDNDPGWRDGSFRRHFIDVVSSTNFLTSCMRQTGVLHWAVIIEPRQSKWKPLWKIPEFTWLKNYPWQKDKESNIERLQKEVMTRNEDSLPVQAVPKVNAGGYSIRKSYGLPPYHCPWHLAIKQLWLDFHLIGKILQYEIVSMPTAHNPYYEAVVCCMPTIRCRAETVDLLQKQLLEQYAAYLKTFPVDRETKFLDENQHPRFWVPRASVNSEYAHSLIREDKAK